MISAAGSCLKILVDTFAYMTPDMDITPGFDINFLSLSFCPPSSFIDIFPFYIAQSAWAVEFIDCFSAEG